MVLDSVGFVVEKIFLSMSHYSYNTNKCTCTFGDMTQYIFVCMREFFIYFCGLFVQFTFLLIHTQPPLPRTKRIHYALPHDFGEGSRKRRRSRRRRGSSNRWKNDDDVKKKDERRKLSSQPNHPKLCTYIFYIRVLVHINKCVYVLSPIYLCIHTI